MIIKYQLLQVRRQQTEIEASRITVLISALKIVQDFVNKNLIRTD